ncbi:Uncharacterised protein [Mycobacterium tuberculosis]|uniref:Uncharacterized protein n=1 Tax=Mycobacterium tuberculosis TaxID=1773 RepID=A0A916P815_MYCTX|nr:Uncharacterised protein [Mycobacterium tuberculosis]
MGLTCGWHRPERAGAQRRITGELPVAHERCDLPGAAVFVDDLVAIGNRGLIDAIDRHPRVTGIVVAAVRVPTHVHVGQSQQGVSAIVDQLRQPVGQVLPQIR